MRRLLAAFLSLGIAIAAKADEQSASPYATAADFAKYHVVLFGDPGSNKWIARVLPRLPVRWTRETVAIGARELPAARHLPALVYPSPLAASRYVMLRDGATTAGYLGDPSQARDSFDRSVDEMLRSIDEPTEIDNAVADPTSSEAA